MVVGEKFYNIRKALGKTLAEVATELGLKGTGHLSQIENSVKKPSPALVLNFKRAYSIRDEWWDYGEGEMFEKNKFKQYAEEIEKTSVKVDQLEYDGNKEGPESNGAEVVSILGHLIRMGSVEDRVRRIKELSEYAAKELMASDSGKKT